MGSGAGAGAGFVTGRGALNRCSDASVAASTTIASSADTDSVGGVMRVSTTPPASTTNKRPCSPVDSIHGCHCGKAMARDELIRATPLAQTVGLLSAR